MDKDFEQLYLRAPENHWWLKSRREAILGMIKHCHRNSRIIEIGCGGGALLSDLRRIGFNNITGVDNSAEAINACKGKGLRDVYQLDGAKLDFRDNSFDMVVASDVLEHIEDDTLALKEWHRILSTKGLVIIFVPAFSFLWSKHDELNHHYRRYTRRMLCDRLEKTGFKIERSGYWSILLFMPLCLARFVENFFGRNFVKTLPQKKSISVDILNSLLSGLMGIENYALFKGIDFPFGASFYAISRK
ncbi:MAG: class I SAM-dependent methyltransferase [Candidatus Portnoybacteria bacterium]|nr:class I SAM-dependent methyltransferase [Candidatus Portnoybacteria bacterium]